MENWGVDNFTKSKEYKELMFNRWRSGLIKTNLTFSDNSWSNGDLYSRLGFVLVSKSYPNYSYIIDKRRSNKQKWKKSNLIKMEFPKELSESKIMEDSFGSYKIFDCGQTKFELYIKQS